MVTHYLVTNRQVRTGKARDRDYLAVNGKEYLRIDGEEEAMDNLRYGEVRFDPGKAAALRDFEVVLHPDLTGEEMRRLGLLNELPANKKPGSRKVFEELYEKGMRAMREEHILVFVHGFNNDLESALRTLADLHRRYVVAGSPIRHIVMFSWPARRNLLKYRDDARDAVKSGYAMARSFNALRDFFLDLIRDGLRRNNDPDMLCGQKIHLLCHSMGNRVLESMLAELRNLGIKPNNMFGEIMLLAADVDDDGMEPAKPLHDLISLGERVHIYYHNEDKALGISEKTKNAFNRLGRWGARRSIPLPDSVYQADVTYIGDEEAPFIQQMGHHWYYLDSPSVVRDVIEVLNGRPSVFQI